MNSLSNCWDSLPRDLIIYVFRSGLEAQDFGRLQKVCKIFKSIIESIEMRRDWENELKGKFLVFRQGYGRVPLDADWRTYYVKDANLILRISKAKADYISDKTEEKLLIWARLLIQREDINTYQSHCKLLWRNHSEFKEDVRLAFNQLILLSQDEDPETEYLIGRLALISTDRVAFPYKYLYQAAKRGYQDAYLHLGKIPVKYKSLLRDTERCFIGKEAKHEVLNFLKMAADIGDVKAQYFIYRYKICFNGKYEGLEYLKMAAEQGYPKALNLMGVYLRDDLQSDPGEIFKYFSLAAQKGCRTAMGNLAVCFGNGFGTKMDVTEAVRYATLAAERGDNQGKFLLGLFFEEGIYVKKDLVLAMNYLHLAAEGGFKDAQFLLARYYFTGNNLKRDQNIGFYYLQLASYQHFQNAHYIEAYCHENGIGTVQDLPRALRYYKYAYNFGIQDGEALLNLIESEKACAQNFGITDYVPSLLKLAHFYEVGKGTASKPAKASRYYELAAAHGITTKGSD